MKAAALAEEVFAKNPLHPGAVHYLIHSYDDPVHAPLGLRARARLREDRAGRRARAPHAVAHLPRLGDVGRRRRVERGVLAAPRTSACRESSSASTSATCTRSSGSSTRICSRARVADARRLLATMEDGREEQRLGPHARQLRRDAGRLRRRDGLSWRTLPADGRAGAAGSVRRRVLRVEEGRREGDRRRDRGSAAESGRKADASASGSGGSGHAHGGRPRRWAATAAGPGVAGVFRMELEAIRARREGRSSRRRRAGSGGGRRPRTGSRFEFGPPVVVKPARELAGELLLAAKKPAEAQKEFELSLRQAPGRSLSLGGLVSAREGRGDRRRTRGAEPRGRPPQGGPRRGLRPARRRSLVEATARAPAAASARSARSSRPGRGAEDRPTFTVGTATAERGHRANGYIDVPAGVDAGTRIPVIVFHGAWPGPVLAIVVGRARHRVRLDRRRREARGAARPRGALRHGHPRPARQPPVVRAQGPARQPGRRQEHEPLLPGQRRRHADGARRARDHPRRRRPLRPPDRPARRRPRREPAAVQLLDRRRATRSSTRRRRRWCSRSASTTSSSPPTGRRIRPRRATSTTRPRRAASPSIAAEAGPRRHGRARGRRRARPTDASRVMRLFKMLAGAPTPVEHPVWIDSREERRRPSRRGSSRRSSERGAYVEQGAKIGTVTRLVRQRRLRGRARPLAGVVLYVCAVPSMRKGDTIANVGVVGEGALRGIGRSGDPVTG